MPEAIRHGVAGLVALAMLAVAPLTAKAEKELVSLNVPGPKLWYRQPAANWNSVLPAGNGRIGAAAYGGVGREMLHLDEVTFWRGSHSYAALREAHVKDHQRLFRRVSLDLGESLNEPTDVRLTNRKNASPRRDLGLDALQFQYARYLLIAGSRENSPLPMTFTGIWNDRRWGVHIGYDDFHLDPDTQMNYWPAEVANVSESHEPLFKLIASLVEPGRRTAKVTYGCRGWVAHTVTNAPQAASRAAISGPWRQAAEPGWRCTCGRVTSSPATRRFWRRRATPF